MEITEYNQNISSIMLEEEDLLARIIEHIDSKRFQRVSQTPHKLLLSPEDNAMEIIRKRGERLFNGQFDEFKGTDHTH